MSLSKNPIFPEPVRDTASIKLALCTWPEIQDYLSNCKGIILPIGSIEQHGPTGAIGTDALTAEAIALEVGRLTGVLVTPTQSFGMAEHHLGFPGTMSLRPETLLNVVNDLLLSLAKHGFERIFVLNGHGGNVATLKAAFHQAYSNASRNKEEFPQNLRCKVASWFMTKSALNHSKELYGDHEGQHATPSEISITMYLEQTLTLKQRKLPAPSPSGPIYSYEDFRSRYFDGRMGSDPYLANPEHGKELLQKTAQELAKDLIHFLSQS